MTTDRITTALLATKLSNPQSFAVSTHYSSKMREGVIFVNLQKLNSYTYAVWYVGSRGNRFAGGYYDKYHDAMTDYNNRFSKIVSRENALEESK